MEQILLSGCWRIRNGTVTALWLLPGKRWNRYCCLVVGGYEMEQILLSGCWRVRDGTDTAV